MEQFWKWIQRVGWLIPIVSFLVSFLKGWSSINDMKLFWNNLSAWQFIFYLSLSVILIRLVVGYYRFKKWVESDLNKKVNSLEKKQLAIEDFDSMNKKIDACNDRINDWRISLNQIKQNISDHYQNHSNQFKKIHEEIENVKQKYKWSVDIISPKDGEKVNRETLVNGTANIPFNSYLWVLVHQKGDERWWLQGKNNVSIIAGKWEIRVFFGSLGQAGIFELAAVVVDTQTNENLKKQIGFAIHSFPNPVEGCPVRTISVDKIGDRIRTLSVDKDNIRG